MFRKKWGSYMYGNIWYVGDQSVRMKLGSVRRKERKFTRMQLKQKFTQDSPFWALSKALQLQSFFTARNFALNTFLSCLYLIISSLQWRTIIASFINILKHRMAQFIRKVQIVRKPFFAWRLFELRELMMKIMVEYFSDNSSWSIGEGRHYTRRWRTHTHITSWK